MRATLEQLKAMDADGLLSLWTRGMFPFEFASCGACLSMHKMMKNCLSASEVEHQVIHARIVELGFPDGRFDRQLAKQHIEELYALRIFYDSLYPQSAEAAPRTEQAIAESCVNAEVGAKA